jgi:hypothetical protein
MHILTEYIIQILKQYLSAITISECRLDGTLETQFSKQSGQSGLKQAISRWYEYKTQPRTHA